MNVIPVTATAIDRGLARCRDCGWLACISHHPFTPDADPLAVTGRTHSSRFGVVSATPAPYSTACAPPVDLKSHPPQLDALATNGGEKCRLEPLPVHKRVDHAHCPRCHAALHLREPDSLSRTWALILAAVLLYIPANVLPIMTVVRFGQGDPHTILGGVQELVHGGQWPLAALVFFASIVVPMLKLVGLSFLAVSVQWRWKWRARDRTRLYRIVESVGRWSMIDIFVISILVALVQLGAVATIAPGVGASFFAAVVIITMFAAEGFDQRLIWDVAGTERTYSSNNKGNCHEA